MDMNSCKPGDKLVCRDGGAAYYLDREGTPHFPHRVRYENRLPEIDTADNNGFNMDDSESFDIVSLARTGFTKDGLLSILDDYRVFQETGTLRDGLLREHVADKPAYLLAITVQNAILDIFLPYAEKYLKEL